MEISPRSPERGLDARAVRRLDRWVGVPLCFAATLLLRLARLFRPRRSTQGRTLYVALAEMGAIVLAAPAIRRQTRRAGTAPAFVTLAPTRAVFDFLGGDFARDVFVLRSERLATLCIDLWRFARWARAQGVAVAIDLDPGARFSALLALLSGAPRRAGFAGRGLPYRGSLYTHRVDCAAERHMSENFAALVRAPFGAAHDAVVAPLRVAAPATPPAVERLRRLKRDSGRERVLLVHANVSDPVPQRRWPRERHLELCRRLLAERDDLIVAFVGAAAEAEAAAALCAELDDPHCLGVAGELEVAELPALFAEATLLLSSDSGPAHFAAHAGLPVVALFGPETPQRYRPLGDAVALHAALPCSPCLSPKNQRASACRDPRCMQAIAVDAVLDEVRARLEAPRRAQASA